MDQNFDRPHQCTFCERKFRKSEHLTRHIRTHTKEKPYSCHCGSSFTRRDLLKRHNRLAHQATEQVEGARSRTPRDDEVASPNATLPLPPEYANIDSLFLSPQPDMNVLSHYNTFFQSSGLQQLANNLSITAAAASRSDHCGDIIEARYESRSPPSNAGLASRCTTTQTSTALTSLDHLKLMDEVYHKLRTTFVEQTNHSIRSLSREQKLIHRIEELERTLALSEQKSAAETEKACAAAREASEWKTQYDTLRRTLKGALGQHP